MRSAFGWAPTIALSWFWGLGFVYAAHVTVTEGWVGFLAFALPNAIGLALFGILLERRGTGDLDTRLRALAGRHALILLTFQALALGLTLFAFWSAVAWPLMGWFALPAVAAVAFAALATGQALGIDALRRLHAVLLFVALAAVAVAVALLPSGAGGELGTPLPGLIVPTVVGFLLGPWLDVQQWHRAAAIARSGGSVKQAYVAAGALFFVLLGINAWLATGAHPPLPIASNGAGMPDATGALASAIGGGGLPTVLFLVYAAIAMATTLDSGWAALRWMLAGRGGGALSAILPPGVIETPFWTLLVATLIATGAAIAGLSPLDLMAPYATLFVGFSAGILLQLVRGATAPDGTVTLLLGALSLIVFGTGYYGDLPLLTTLAPLIPLCAACVRAPAPVVAGAAADRANVSLTGPSSEPMLPVPCDASLAPAYGNFDGEWFNLVFVPTYDDTNSVGNVYFANYIRWVGKARELFFAKCLPKFDLKTTTFLILTRDVFHQFVSEIREFETAVVRLRIGKMNRKFASLEHEIRTDDGRLIGKGNQQLMFVDAVGYRLIDIPGEVIAGFFPFASKRHQDAHTAGMRSVGPF